MATENHHSEEIESPEIHFEPIVQLPTVEVITHEEEEEELLQLRAKLFRFDNSLNPPEWKERGTGNVKILKHKKSQLVRVLMRRDKTLKTCANHYIQPEMELKPNCGSDRAWVWTSTSDFADGEPKPELLAIRFANAENAQKFKEKFNEGKEMMKVAIPKHNASLHNNDVKSPDKIKQDGEAEKAGGDTDTQSDSRVTEKVEVNQSYSEADSVANKLESLSVKEKSSDSQGGSENSAEKSQVSKGDSGESGSKDATEQKEETEKKDD